VLHFALPVADRLPRASDPDAQGRLARHAQTPPVSPWPSRRRFLPRVDLGGLRRPARPSRSRRPTGATSTRSARAASTTKPSASHEAITMGLSRGPRRDTRIVRIFNTYGERNAPARRRVVPP
jgi:hypothetical protein